MVYVLGFLAVLLAFEGFGLLVRGRRSSDPQRVRQRLRALAPIRTEGGASDERSLMRARAAGGPLGWLLRAIPRADAFELLLYRAGMPTTLPKLVLMSALLAGLGYTAAAIFTGSTLRGALGLLAGLVPFLTVRRAAIRRMRRLEDQLPEGLELLTRALRAGHGLSSGFQLVGDELEDPIGTEFGLVAEEVRYGLDLRDALENMVQRVQNPDLPYFTTAVLIQRQTGGNLAELLDKLSTLLRERQQFFGRVRALTAQGRGAALFLACWLPIITIIVQMVAPEYLQPLYENSWGHAVLLGAATTDVFAYLLARRIANVQA
jgi:tight adherence protein B